MYGDSGNVRSFSSLVNKGEKYYIKVTQGDYAYATSDTGSYWIGFTDFPARPEKKIIELLMDNWQNSTINTVAGGDSYDWYTFTATSNEQYVHVKFSTMTNLNTYLYDKDLNLISTYEHLYGDSSDVKSFSRFVNNGEKYYIKITKGDYAYGTSDTGSYWIAFNENNIAPK